MLNWPDTLTQISVIIQYIGWAFFPILLLPIILALFPKSKTLKDICDAIIRTVDGLNFLLGEVAKWALPLLVLTVAFSVFALSIFGLSWTKLFESAEYLHATAILLGAGATLLAGQHVRVDIFHSQMSPSSRAMVDLIGFYLLLAPVCLIILWNSQSFTTFAWMIFEGSAESDGIRGEFLLKTLIPAFSILMLLQGLSIALRSILLLVSDQRPTRPPYTPPLFHDTEPSQ